jgi:putative spermidine/putrescine transport system substrate-binding protein
MLSEDAHEKPRHRRRRTNRGENDMTKLIGMNRRAVLGTGLAGTALLAAPGLLRAQDRSLKVGVYGGYFKDSFDQHIFPEFTAATGIAVESIAEPTGEAWLVQLEQAARANQAPADVSMMANVPMLKGQATELWVRLDETKLPTLEGLLPQFVNRYPDGGVAGVGAVAWYITLVTNTDTFPEAPTSWAALWDEANRDRLGLLALVSNSFLLEVTATTFFDGTGILDTEEGINQVLEKLAEVKPNVRLWYRDEAQFEQALKSGEIPMGQYYHDVTGLAAADGFPVRSTFPQEGGILDSGCWAVTPGLDEARRGARVHQLHGPAGDPGADVAPGRHRADRAARADRPDRRGIRRGLLGHRADHPALRHLYRAGRLAEPALDRDHRRLRPGACPGSSSAGSPSASASSPRWRTCRSPCRTGASSACSGPRAAARPRCCAWSRGSRRRTRARSCSTGRTSPPCRPTGASSAWCSSRSRSSRI